MLRDVLCRKCDNVVITETTIKTTKSKKGNKLCRQCKEISLQKHAEVMIARNTSVKLRTLNSARMKKNNPMKNEVVAKKVSENAKMKYASGERKSQFQDPVLLAAIKAKGKITPAGRKRISDRMKCSNPMKNPEIAKKMAETQKRKVLSGEKIYKKGKEHHLWKGNRIFSETCRVRLHPVWTFPIMERDKFCCVKCQSNRKLQVHHTRPLREIIEEVKKEHGIKSFTEIPSENWEPYIQNVLDKHGLEDGMTVCEYCHWEIDEQYRNFGTKTTGGPCDQESQV